MRRSTRASRVPKHTGKDYRYSRDIPAFPAQWFYGLYVLSPVSGLFATVAGVGLTTRLDARVAAPGPHDFAVRCGVSSGLLSQSLTPQASIATRTTLRGDAHRPSGGTGWAGLYCKSELL